MYYIPSASRVKGHYNIIDTQRKGNCAFEAALRTNGQAAEIKHVLRLRVLAADELRKNREEYQVNAKWLNQDSRPTKEEIKRRMEYDTEELAEMEGNLLLYREICDRVGSHGNFVGESGWRAIGAVLGRRIVCWSISAGGIKRSKFLAYGPENAPELPLLYDMGSSHFEGLRFSNEAQTLRGATLPSPDQVCVTPSAFLVDIC